MWDPAQYLQFGDERSRPFFDLLARVGGRDPGYRGRPRLRPGQADRHAGRAAGRARRCCGVDSSAEMIEAAQARLRRGRGPGRAGSSFAARLTSRTGSPHGPVDVIISNAVLQWVPGHLDLLTAVGRLAGRRAAGWPSSCPATSTSPATPSCASWPAPPVAAAAGRRPAEPAGRATRRTTWTCWPGRAARWTPGRPPTCTCCTARTRCSTGTGAPGCARCSPRCRRPRRRSSWPSTGRGCARPTRRRRTARCCRSAGSSWSRGPAVARPARARLLRLAGQPASWPPRRRSAGLGSSWDRPFQARLTRCAATSSSFGLRASSHHWPVNATMPTSICAYIGASFGS